MLFISILLLQNLQKKEVEAAVMSKKTYMKRWYHLTDDEVNDELMQIALERQILDDSSFDLNNGYNGDNKFINPGVDDIGYLNRAREVGADSIYFKDASQMELMICQTMVHIMYLMRVPVM